MERHLQIARLPHHLRSREALLVGKILLCRDHTTDQLAFRAVGPKTKEFHIQSQARSNRCKAQTKARTSKGYFLELEDADKSPQGSTKCRPSSAK